MCVYYKAYILSRFKQAVQLTPNKIVFYLMWTRKNVVITTYKYDIKFFFLLHV